MRWTVHESGRAPAHMACPILCMTRVSATPTSTWLELLWPTFHLTMLPDWTGHWIELSQMVLCPRFRTCKFPSLHILLIEAGCLPRRLGRVLMPGLSGLGKPDGIWLKRMKRWLRLAYKENCRLCPIRGDMRRQRSRERLMHQCIISLCGTALEGRGWS